MAFLRSIVTPSTIAASALPCAFALSHSFSYSSEEHQNPKSQKSSLHFSQSQNSIFSPNRLSLVKTFAHPPQALHVDAPISDQNRKPTTQEDMALPELLTEYMVDMKCEGCVKSVKEKLQTVNGIKNVDVDLDNQVVRVLGSSPLKTMTEALEQTGRKCRLIGQGVPEDFLVSAAVAEFKGPEIFGVVRFAQVNMELARIEANISGLSPGKHGWSINEYGDLTRGVSTTGKVFNPTKQTKPLGDLGTLDANENGEATFIGSKEKLRVSDLIGRALAVYETENKSDTGITAAVIARSAGVGENYKKICSCDGTTIWEATNSDFVASKV